MRSEDVVGLIEATLALAFPTASTQGLTRAAEAVARWGAEDAAQYLDDPLALRMITDLLRVAGVPEGDYRPAEPSGRAMEWESEYRVWSHTDEMPSLPYLPRPPDRPRRTRGTRRGEDGERSPFGERPEYEGDRAYEETERGERQEGYGARELGLEGDYGPGPAPEADRPRGRRWPFRRNRDEGRNG
ncbi:hypothetical protein ABZV64_27120 [Streptomyces sp. NPDC004959]|uniref:hypothetical protein n=1 Tax=unclassified Streptomyces TaxID=2593676 RepID=UPI001F47354B|nr:hypothetical protein [Streptomyces sp. NRRL F-5630]